MSVAHVTAPPPLASPGPVGVLQMVAKEKLPASVFSRPETPGAASKGHATRAAAGNGLCIAALDWEAWISIVNTYMLTKTVRYIPVI